MHEILHPCIQLCCLSVYKALFGDRPSRRNLLSKGRAEASSAVQPQPEACQTQLHFLVSFIEIFFVMTLHVTTLFTMSII